MHNMRFLLSPPRASSRLLECRDKLFAQGIRINPAFSDPHSVSSSLG